MIQVSNLGNFQSCCSRLRHHLRRFSVALLCLLLCSSTLAQEFDAVAADPEGTRHALALWEAFATEGSAQTERFLELYESDPNLSRRAFLPLYELWDREQDPQRNEQFERLLPELAALAMERFADPIPNLIIDVINEQSESDDPNAFDLARRYTSYLLREAQSGRKLSARQLRLYGPYSFSYDYVETVTDIPPLVFQLFTPLSVWDARTATSFQLENYNLNWQEQESYLLVLQRVRQTAREMGLEDQSLETRQVVQNDPTYNEVFVKLDAGLLDQAMLIIEQRPQQPDQFDSNWTLAYLAALRRAYEQGRLPLVKRLRELIERELNKDPDVSGSQPVLQYLLHTADFRRRRLEGYDPTEQEVIAEFQKAWSALDSYQPMRSPRVDGAWREGRHADRFWHDQLAEFNHSEEQLACLQAMDKAWYFWWREALNKQAEIESPEALLYRFDYLETFYALGAAYFDQLTYRWASFPTIEVSPEDLRFAQTAIQALPDRIGFVLELDPQAKEYPLGASGLMPEMLSRIRLVEARWNHLDLATRLGLLEESVQLARAGTQPSSRATHLLSVGFAFKQLGQSEPALACWREALELTDDVPLAVPAFEALFLLAREHFERQDWEQATVYAQAALEKLEAVSPLIGVRSLEARRWSQRLSTITSLTARAYIAADEPTKALAAITRGQQLQSAALEVEGRREIKQQGEELRRQQRQVAAATEQVKKLEAQPASPARDDLLTRARDLLAESRSEYLVKSRELRQKHATLYSQALKFDPLDLPALQSQLPQDVAVLQYFPTEDTLYTFLVSKDTFRLRSVKVNQAELDRLLVDYLRALRRNTPGDSRLAQQSRQLHDLLVAPSVPDLEGKGSLVLIPSGRLHSLPFASLTDEEGRAVVDRWRLLELAKSTDLQRLARGTAEPFESVVAFANATEDLPAAAAEGQKIASIFPHSRLFEAKDATRSNFFSYGDKAQVLHLATHGEWNLDDSLKNYLALAGSERIAQDEIFQLSLEDTSLVILSACNTAMGEGSENGHVASLAEAFWLAGSRSVVASLWAVNDDSTSLLMETFYRRLRAGEDKAEALRNAQLEVRGREGFEHPYYWAGFVLFGER